MAYLEIIKDGKTVRRQRVPDERAKAGFVARLAGQPPVRVKLGETTRAGEYELRVVPDSTDADGTSETSEPSEPSGAGKRAPHLDGYELHERLGEGGMGVVWKGVQQSTRRTVAVKFLGRRAFGSDRSRKRFEREVHLSARLEHPAIVRVYDSGLVHGAYFYAMELIDGKPLDEFAVENHLSREAILRLFKTLCDAVQHAHDRGVIHRDLKPSNVLVTKDGQPHVLDFGLAKSLIEEEDENNHHVTMSMEGEATGTPAYMSPEQAAGRHAQTDGRTDVWSIGVMLYRLLVGQPPHDLSGTRFDVAKRIVEEEIRSPRTLGASIGADLEGLLRKAMARDPQDRYATPGELGQDIDNYLTGRPLIARKATVLYRVHKRFARQRLLVASCVVLAVIAVPLAIGLLPGGWIRARLTDTRTVRIIQPAAIQKVYLPATQTTAALSGSSEVVEPAAIREMLFEGTDLSKWISRRNGGAAPWSVRNGYVEVNGTGDIVTKEKFKDFKLHAEFWCPDSGNAVGQARGNSGIYLQGRYEIQILDSYGVKKPDDQDCGAIAIQSAPAVNACKPPEQWQTFDITFHAARFDAAGNRLTKATVTVLQNGQMIQNQVEINGSTLQGDPESDTPGPIRLQDHKNPVRFRNIWIEPLNVQDSHVDASNLAAQCNQQIDLVQGIDPSDGIGEKVSQVKALSYVAKQLLDQKQSAEAANQYQAAITLCGQIVAQDAQRQKDAVEQWKDHPEIGLSDAERAESIAAIKALQPFCGAYNIKVNDPKHVGSMWPSTALCRIRYGGLVFTFQLNEPYRGYREMSVLTYDVKQKKIVGTKNIRGHGWHDEGVKLTPNELEFLVDRYDDHLILNKDRSIHCQYFDANGHSHTVFDGTPGWPEIAAWPGESDSAPAPASVKSALQPGDPLAGALLPLPGNDSKEAHASMYMLRLDAAVVIDDWEEATQILQILHSQFADARVYAEQSATLAAWTREIAEADRETGELRAKSIASQPSSQP